MEVSVPVYLNGARVVKQKGDNRCLFHALSYCLSYDDIHETSTGFCMREMITNYIRDNEDTVICIELTSFPPQHSKLALHTTTEKMRHERGRYFPILPLAGNPTAAKLRSECF